MFSTFRWGDNNFEQGVWSPAHVFIPWMWWGPLLWSGYLVYRKASTIRNEHPGVCLETFLWLWVYVHGKYFEIFQLSTFSNLRWHWLGGNLADPLSSEGWKSLVIEPELLTLSAAGDGAVWGISIVNSSQCFPFTTFLLGCSHYLFKICAKYQEKQLCFRCDIIPSVLHTAWMFSYMHLTPTWEGWWGTWASLEFIPFLPLQVCRDYSHHFIRLRSVRWSGRILQGALPMGVNIGWIMEVLLWKFKKSAPASLPCNSV